MDVAIMPLGKIEADVDMLPGLGVGVFIPRQAADHVAALLERLVEQFGSSGIAHNPFLREGDDLYIAAVPVFFTYEQESLRGTQSADRSDIGKQPKECRSIRDP